MMMIPDTKLQSLYTFFVEELKLSFERKKSLVEPLSKMSYKEEREWDKMLTFTNLPNAQWRHKSLKVSFIKLKSCK